MQFHDYHDGDTMLEAAVARPADARQAAPAVLIAHQWAGQGENEHAAARRVAALGYIGIAIDVYGKGVRGEPGGDHSHLIQPWMADRAALLRRLRAAVTFARGLDRVDGARLAMIGYCFGGLCALDLARGGADGVRGVASVHGLLDGNGLAPSGPIAPKVLAEHGWLDPMAAPDKVVAFGAEMTARQADWQLHAHGRAMHAFTTKGAADPDHGLAYDADADRRSWASITAFLAEVLA